tara:strand:+ start:208 stop:633 length:426 start_codon:yes stop_codon:yes gene_type:complete
MKSFKNYLAELNHTSNQDLAVDKNINPIAFTQPEVVGKLNKWVGTIAGSYVLPEDAIHRLRSSLMKIGLTFDSVPEFTEEKGEVNMPLTLFGGRFGKGVDTPHEEFEQDDGISHMVEGGLALVIGYEKNEDNSCRLTASIK